MSKDQDNSSALYQMKSLGFGFIPQLIDPALAENLKNEILQWYEETADLRKKAGVHTAWGTHHFVEKKSFIDLLETKKYASFCNDFFEGKPYIMHSTGASINPDAKSGESYEHGRQWHRDCQSFRGAKKDFIVLLVMLDDFTKENGGTEFILGSHHIEQYPSSEYMEKNTTQVTGKAGDGFFIYGDLVHRVGKNTTDKKRLALTVAFTKPFEKQLLDYPRMLGLDSKVNYSENVQQVLGFNATIPSSLEEWYVPAKDRLYKKGQG